MLCLKGWVLSHEDVEFLLAGLSSFSCVCLTSLVPCREPLGSLSPEERDARTVFCMQLAARIRPRDLEDFFSAVGKVRYFGWLVSAYTLCSLLLPSQVDLEASVFLVYMYSA